jgi:hypothetical protein
MERGGLAGGGAAALVTLEHDQQADVTNGQRRRAARQVSRARTWSATAERLVSVMLAEPSAATVTAGPVHAAAVAPLAGVKLYCATLQ